MATPDQAGYYKQEDILNVDYAPPRTAWMDTPVDFRHGSYIYPGKPKNLEILGLLLTFVDSRTKLSKQVQRQMREHFGDLVFDTVIHKDVRLAEAPSAHESVYSYAPDSNGAIEHKILAEEIG